MATILVPVDGSEYSDAAVREAIKAVKQTGGEIHLLNVQPRIFAEVSLIYLPADKVDTIYYEQSGKALASAEKLAQEAGVQFASHRAVGAIAETILGKVGELGCDSIIMGTHGRGRVAELFVGSVAQRVLALARVPVTLVKTPRPLEKSGTMGLP